jgi:16S rRNA (guanine966-N2)-methyltransferase
MAGNRSSESGQLRIIGGRWRGRKLRFRAARGLRPTPDRVRETLFNWLAADLPGARCIDLFAGSGALGLEALSRGADCVCFVDNNAHALARIEQHLRALDCSDGLCHCANTLTLLAAGNAGQPWDIAFLDPPFGEGLLEPSIAALETGGWLAGNACVYLEASKHEPPPKVPANWLQHREKSAGDVRFSLFVRPA